jgi:hypothetical protein
MKNYNMCPDEDRMDLFLYGNDRFPVMYIESAGNLNVVCALTE